MSRKSGTPAPHLVDEAQAAWHRREVAAAVANALAAHDEAVAPDAGGAAPSEADALAALHLACTLALRGHRVDLLLPYSSAVETLPAGPVRDGILATMRLGAGDLDGAISLALAATYDHDHARARAPRDAEDARAEGDAVLPALLISLAIAAVSAGAWMPARDCIAAARSILAASVALVTPVLPPSTVLPLSTAAPDLRFDLLGLDALIELHTSGGDTAQAALAEALAPLRVRNSLTSTHALALICLGSVEHTTGRLGEAALNLARGARLVDASRPGLRLSAEVELAFVRLRQGRWQDAADVVRTTTPPRGAIDHDWLEPAALAVHGLLLALDGDLASARPVLDRAALLCRDTPSYLAAIMLTHARLIVAIAQSDWRELRRALEDAGEPGYRHPYRDGEWRMITLLSAWHLRRYPDFHGGIAAWAEQPEAADDPYYWAFVSIQAEHEGRYGDAITAVERSLACLSLDDDALGRAWVRMVAGICFSRYGASGAPDPVRALAAYEEAGAELRDLGAAALVARADAIIADTTAELAPARANHPASLLTAQQRRVAQAVGQGYTSGEVAGILHLSKRTVDYHVANIMRRLGATTRREIARILAGSPGR